MQRTRLRHQQSETWETKLRASQYVFFVALKVLNTSTKLDPLSAGEGRIPRSVTKKPVARNRNVTV